eukprot:COSAG06_NODE_7931_length_2330_cov_2.569251_2_plen_216_part_00
MFTPLPQRSSSSCAEEVLSAAGLTAMPQIVASMVELVKTQGKAMAGLEDALTFFEVRHVYDTAWRPFQSESHLQLHSTEIACCLLPLQSKGLPLAVASSSHMVLLNAALEGLGLVGRFSHVISAEFEPYGKPHPGVYISAATALGVAPDRCLALEDSVNGTLAAKAAKMICIAVPEPHNFPDPRYAIADLKLASLAEVPAEMTALWSKGDGAGPT